MRIVVVMCLCLKGPYFSFLRSDPDTTWNVSDMETALNVCRCKLPPRSDVDDAASQPHRIYVLFKAPPQSSHADCEGKYRCSLLRLLLAFSPVSVFCMCQFLSSRACRMIKSLPVRGTGKDLPVPRGKTR